MVIANEHESIANGIAVDIAETELFKNVQDSTLESARASIRMRSWLANKFIFEQDEKSADLYIVLEGQLQSQSYSVDGKEVFFRQHNPGDVFGEFAVIDGEARSSAILSVGASETGTIPRTEFMTMLENDFQLSLNLMHILVRKCRAVSDSIFERQVFRVRERIGREFLRLATGNNGSLPDGPVEIEGFSQTALASRVGCRREEVSREISRLAKLNILQKKARLLTLVDLPRLAELCDFFEE